MSKKNNWFWNYADEDVEEPRMFYDENDIKNAHWAGFTQGGLIMFLVGLAIGAGIFGL